jgi:hypothetical protein
MGTTSAHPLWLYAGGSSRLTIASAGNVTINAPSSGTALTVNQSGSTSGVNNVAASGNNSVITISQTSVASWLLYSPASSTDFRINNGSGDLVTLSTSGNLGIGTSSPAYKLQVQKSADGGLAYFRNTSGSNQPALYIKTNDASNIVGFDTDYALSTSPAITFSTGGAERMRLDNSGNLGIGTSSPSGLLTLNKASGAYGLNLDGSGYGTLAQFGIVNVGSNNNSFIGSISNNDFLIKTNNSTVATFDTSGNLLVGTTSANSARVNAKAFDSAGNYFALYTKNSSDTALLSVRSDGYLLTGVAANSPYNATTAYAGNVFVQTDGGLYRSTSSLRYKTDVQNAVHGLAELMKLRPVTYRGKNDGDKVFGGLIAEEVHDAGLAEFVLYDLDSNPDAIFYGPMVSLCIKAMQEQQALIESLTARLNSLENK